MGGIIWLASYPNSGNTWVRAFLYNLFRNPDKPAPPNELARLTYGDSSKEWFRAVSKVPLEQLSEAEISKLRPAVHRPLTRLEPGTIFVKTHNWLGPIIEVPSITMECTAGAIYVVRNPLDMVSSLASHFGTDIDGAIAMLNDPNEGAPPDDRQVVQFYSDWSSHVKSWTQRENRALHVMRYEDMVAKPIDAFGGLVKFLGVDANRKRIRKAIEFSSFRVLQKLERTQGFRERSVHAESFFRRGKTGAWQDDLSDEQVARIVSHNREQMERFGYLP